MRHPRSVWTVPTTGFNGAHFATYPPALIRPMILAGCPRGGLVIDPFFGSGTTGVVANELGRDCIGIDINAEYCRMARRRLGKRR
jgi:DNA modification methylase